MEPVHSLAARDVRAVIIFNSAGQKTLILPHARLEVVS